MADKKKQDPSGWLKATHFGVLCVLEVKKVGKGRNLLSSNVICCSLYSHHNKISLVDKKTPSCTNAMTLPIKAAAAAAAAAAKSFQSCPTLCDPIDDSPPGSLVPGILQARTLEWVAISFSNAWEEKWKWSRSVMSDSWWPHGLQPSRLLRPWDFPGKILAFRKA